MPQRAAGLRRAVARGRRVVVKVGSSSLTSAGGGHLDPGALSLLVDTLFAQPSYHIGMRFVNDVSVRVLCPHRTQQPHIAALTRRTICQRRIALHLTGHQYHPLGMRWSEPHPATHVVLGQTRRNNALTQTRSTCTRSITKDMGCQYDLQIRGCRCVVIDSARIDHPRKRPHQLRTEPNRP